MTKPLAKLLSGSFLRATLASATLGLLAGAAACAAPTDAEEDLGEVVDASDALTSDEAAAGASWNPEEHDDLSPEEEAALGKTVDDSNDPGPPVDPADGELAPSALGILNTGCTPTTGYSRGKAKKICTTTVNGKPIEVNTAKAFVRMRDDAKRAGVEIIVVSGFRSMAQQRELYKLYKAGRGNLAAPPGFSNHQSGLALDLNARAPGVYAWLTRNGAKYGFKRTVPSENWHWEKR